MNLNLIGLNRTRTDQIGSKLARPDETDSSRINLTRASSPDPRPPPHPTTSPAISSTAAVREGGVGFVSMRGIQRHPPRRPPSPVLRWRARFTSEKEAELGGAVDTTATKTNGSERLTMAGRWCRRRAAT
jgi:hypothetical protein